jgi:P4 family phage/plasmid primase-like protien
METSTTFKTFLDAAKHPKGSDMKTITHTRIGCKEPQIYGGSFDIPPEHFEKFWRLYYQHVFVSGQKEYLTEKQLPEGGPILIDLDFRYPYAISQRLHNEDDIIHILCVYFDEIAKLYQFDAQEIPIYVMEKKTVNRVAESNVTKDGIHIIIGLQMDSHMKVILRNRVLANLASNLARLPLQNTLEDVVDKGVALGTTNWQVYGSRKPNHESYELTYRYAAVYEESVGQFVIQECEEEFNLQRDIFKLSAQYPHHVSYEIHPDVRADYDRLKAGAAAKTGTRINRPSSNQRLADPATPASTAPTEELLPYDQITDGEILIQQVNIIMNSLRSDDHHIRETHEYTQILPEKFYRPGSHDLNTKVAFALKNTDERLFLSWVMLRAKAEDFNYADVPELKRRWDHGLENTSSREVLTRRTIMYYAKQENPSEYQRILEKSSEYYVTKSLKDGSDWDLGMVLYQLYKDKYVCASVEKKIWYTYKDHRWVQDKGSSIRKVISVDMYNIYDRIRQARKEDEKKCKKELSVLIKQKKGNDSDIKEEEIDAMKDKYDAIKDALEMIIKITAKLKSTGNKNNLITEASTLFFDADFIDKADSKTTLICFTNGVWDFSDDVKAFRPGVPQDYLTKCTGVAFIPEEDRHASMVEDITAFMNQLFPTRGLNRYMWDHLASCLVGENKAQTFNIYLGSGRNGKSKLTALMSHCFGDYKGTVPITLVTQKRGDIGGTSSEVVQLKGVRYAVMQEPTKNNCTLNEGVMKELTGGDPITARGLYKDSETFTPQLSLVVCSNILFDINSTDEGTWRRIRVCRFMSKFVDDPTAKQDTESRYLFKVDYNLDQKLKIWASTFISMLVSRYLTTDGNVADCDEVIEESRKYQEGQDMVSAFITDMIEVVPEEDREHNAAVKKSYVFGCFKRWVEINYNGQKAPKASELYEVLEKKFQKPKSSGWKNIKLKNENEDLEETS